MASLREFWEICRGKVFNFLSLISRQATEFMKFLAEFDRILHIKRHTGVEAVELQLFGLRKG